MAGVGLAMIAAGRMAWVQFAPEVIMNYTHSEPRGMYRVYRIDGREAQRGDQILFPVPPQWQRLVVNRGWINAGHPFIKQVGALAGDTVCVTDRDLSINGKTIGPVFLSDSLGRSLPVFRGCHVIPQGQFFPLSTYTDKSFDGRYIGPQPLTSIYAKVIPVWTF